MDRRPPGLLFVLALACFATRGESMVRGDDFRILSKIYVGAEKKPACRNSTLFTSGLVYDCMTHPEEEIAVFDPLRSRFVLLQPRGRVRAELSLKEVSDFVFRLRQELKGGRGMSAFLANPEFKQLTPSKEEVTFSGRWLTYKMKTRAAKTPSIANQYADFSNWYTRLNAMKNPSLLARLPVNDFLKAQGHLPTEIDLTIYKKTALGRMKEQARFRSEHVVYHNLTRDDREKIDQIGRWLVQFDQVDYSEYKKLAQDRQKTASR